MVDDEVKAGGGAGAKAVRRRGFTLIEIVVAFSLLAVLVVLSLSVISNMSGPTTEVTLRADMSNKGNATSSLLIRELQGGTFSTPDAIVASYTGTSYVTDYSVVDPTAHSDSPPRDKAIKFASFGSFTPPDTIVPGPDVIFAFEPDDSGDGDRDGLQNEWRLIRISPPGSSPVIIQKDICAGAQPNLPVGVSVEDPYFELSWPASLRVVFSLAKQTGYDTQTQTRLYSVLRFEHTIHLRNVQRP